MANIIKELQTRIALKYDSYTAWTTAPGKDLVLLKGEVGICEIPAVNTDSNVAPTVLFKVGDGEKTFEKLPWTSAKAADVYNWAKSETVVLDGTYLRFKTGSTVNHSVDLSSFATDAEVALIEARISAIEGSLGNGGSVAEQLDTMNDRLDVIQGTGEGSVSKALSDAKDYTDTREAAIETAYKAYADQAEADAKTAANSYTDGKVATLTAKDSALEAKDAQLESSISANTTAISNEATARADADTAINEKIGGNYSKTSTVADAIADAKKAGTDAQAAVNALTAEGGAVTVNAANIAALQASLNTETQNRESADSALSGRLDRVEAFFEAADHDGEAGGLNDALDTLVEIQTYITSEGAAADEMVKDIKQNADDITALQTLVSGENGLAAQIAGNDADIASLLNKVGANETNILTLQQITSGYTGEGAILNAINAVNTKAEQGIADAKKAQDDVDALGTTVGNATTGLAATNKIAKDNSAAIAALDTRVTTAESDIDALEATVNTGANSNQKLRDDITNLATLTSDASKGNEKLRTDLDTVTNKVNDGTTGLAATKAIADAASAKAATNETRIAGIEADYLKEADSFILDCGSASLVTYTA